MEVELQRRTVSGDLVPWNLNDDGTDPVADSIARDRLATIIARLGDLITLIDANEAVALDAATLAALENIVVSGTIALDTATLAALESITAKLSVSGVDVTQNNPLPVTGTFTDANGSPYDINNPLPVDVGANIEIGELTVEFSGIISTLNFINYLLQPNEEYVGTWEDVSDFAAVQAAVFTDQPSATNGVVAEFSTNGVDVVRSIPTTLTAGFGAYFSFPVQARYFRIRYKNGAFAQTVFRNQVRFTRTAPGGSQQPLGATITDANIAEVVRSTIGGRVYSGPYTGVHIPLQVNTLGHLSTRVENAVSLDASQVADMKKTTGIPKRIERDMAGRGDDQQVYLGTAAPGAADNAAVWTVYKFRYESTANDARMLGDDVRENIKWTNRADPTQDGAAAWSF